MDISEAEALIQQQSLAIDLLQERLSTLEMAIPEIGNGWDLNKHWYNMGNNWISDGHLQIIYAR